MLRRPLWIASLALFLAAAIVSGCSGVLKKQYEYEEELYLSLDGSATLNVNSSVAALVALRGADLDVNPRARLDRMRVRALFEGPGVVVRRVGLSRRAGRRFVHASLAVDDVRQLARVTPFAWSSYRFDRDDDVFAFRQVVGRSAGKAPLDVGWTGRELVAFRMHLPSRIVYHNAPSRQVERGNILSWEQPLTERLRGAPLDVQVQMETQSILYRTLLLFGATIVAAALAFAIVLWWLMRRGRRAEMAELKLL